MKRPLYLPLALLAVPCLLPASEGPEALTQAREATGHLASALKSELVSAMQSGGTASAIEVCHTRAEAIAEEVSAANGLSVSRVSARNRSPENRANAWQQEVLELFEQRKIQGASAAELTWHATVHTSSGSEFRYMQAIMTGGLCLQCHGAQLAPETAQKLSKLYPDDQATGYRAGDIRGAFVVTVPQP